MVTSKILFFLLSGILSLTSTVSGDITKCSRPCRENQKVMFKQAHTYVYHYRADSYSYVNVTNKQQQDAAYNSLKLSAEIQLHIMTPCYFVMEIYNASLQDIKDDEPNYYRSFSESLAKHEVRFHYHNGIIEELCVAKSEPDWVLNIKRGILSMLQFEMTNTTSNYTTVEKTIWGTCKTDYTSGELDGWKTLKRKRIYKDCLQWGGEETFRSDSFDQKYIEAIDLFKNTQVCKYVLGNMEQPVQVTCKERQKFHAHASKVNLAVSNITQHLDLDRVIIKQRESELAEGEFIHENITFKFVNKENTLDLSNLEEFIQHTNRMYESDFKDIMTLHSFNTLIRNATYDELMNLFKTFESQYQQHISLLVKAILRAKTTASIKMVNYLHWRKIIRDYELILWLKSLPFIKYPSKQLLSDVKMFLHVEDADLAISGLVLNFCRNTANCTDDENVKYYTNYWDALLKTHLKNFNQRNLTLALLAIGNTGLTNQIHLIGEIITKSTLPPMLRMTAIESLRKMSCSSKTQYLKETFTRWRDNAEVRISSYLALCKCPSDDILHHIIVSFNVEGINEVTTFIWDHFRKSQTLPETWRNNITQIIQDSFLKTEYMTYIPNHAKYFEYYGNFSIFNSKIELTSINMYQNTLPWSSYAKFSMGLFGNDADKIEIFGRVRDINGVIESLFPKKYPSTEDDKYSSEDSIADNIISVEDKILHPLTDHRYLQSGLIVTRVFDIDINTANPLNVSYALLEVIRQYSNTFKRTLDMETFGVTNVTYQFPTSVGYMLEYNICMKSNGGISLSKMEQNYKSKPVPRFNMGLSAVLSSHNILLTTISHDAYLTKPTLHSAIAFDFQTMIKAEALVEQNKIHKFFFDMKPMLSNNNMFNITKYV